MSSVRTIKSSNYVQIHNKAGLDKKLSAKAKGILLTALILPPEYEINKTTFHQHFKDGRDSIKGGIEELVLAGYGFHEQILIDGKFDAITLITDVKLSEICDVNDTVLELIFPEISDDLRYALKRIRETGTTYIGKLHNDAKKTKENNTVTENQSRKERHEKSVSNKYSNNKNDNSISNKEIDIDNNLPTGLNIDDDKPSFQKSNYNEQQVTYIIEKLTLQFKAYMNMKSINAIIRKVKHKFENGQVSDLQEYLFTSLNNKLIELETKRMKEEETKFVKEENKEDYKPMGIPFYNWLEEKK